MVVYFMGYSTITIRGSLHKLFNSQDTCSCARQMAFHLSSYLPHFSLHCVSPTTRFFLHSTFPEIQPRVWLWAYSVQNVGRLDVFIVSLHVLT